MKIFFAMDLIGGQAVRLVKGDFEQKTVYSQDPLSNIRKMKEEGARDFHIIDLDGARTGSSAHRGLIAEARKSVDGYLETGGGIRSAEDIEFYTSKGVDGVILGTRALTDPLFFDGLSRFKNIVLGLDMHEGRLMVKGWQEPALLEMEKVLVDAQRVGIMALLCTNIAHDGMLTGPDFDGLARMQSLTKLPVIASGGVSCIDDLKRLKEMGLWAAIVGKAYYEGKIKIEEAMAYAD
jgi:phosphoribosylformimino-5-aminoimidazole carboxamide ribotide isomerase